MINIPKGTKDMLPSEAYKWHFIEECARETAKLYGVKEIRTPVFEHTELFLRGVGDTTDIVSKEMYTFNDKGNRSITLKPEGTAGVARAFIENGLINEAMPVKLYYLTPVFRYERPQAGRLRQHHQFGVEMFGSKSASVDAELILCANTFFKRLNIKNLKVNINSIGCKVCRPAYNEALIAFLSKHKDALCPQCVARMEKNPLRVLDCKEEGCKALIFGAPATVDYLCGECDSHFTDLKAHLDNAGIGYTVNPRIVRGLDYYTKTVFEFVSEHLGAQSTVCGGGRYDGLIEQIGGKSVPGVGFGLGLERLLLMMENMGIGIYKPHYTDAYIAPLGKDNYDFCLKLAMQLRAEGIATEIDHMDRSLKSQMKYADKIGAQFVIIVGSKEIEENQVQVKNMLYGMEDKVSLGLITEYIKGNKE